LFPFWELNCFPLKFVVNLNDISIVHSNDISNYRLFQRYDYFLLSKALLCRPKALAFEKSEVSEKQNFLKKIFDPAPIFPLKQSSHFGNTIIPFDKLLFPFWELNCSLCKTIVPFGKVNFGKNENLKKIFLRGWGIDFPFVRLLFPFWELNCSFWKSQL